MEILQRRKFCREFLNQYNEILHPEIISKVFEIGLLILKRHFNKLLFSKEELDEIIKILNDKEYIDLLPLSPFKKIKKLHISSRGDENHKNKQFDLNREINNSDYLNSQLLRDKRIYYNKLKSPNFKTQNRAIYPYWWWNNRDEEELVKPDKNNNSIYEDENDDKNDYYEDKYNNNEIYEEYDNNEDYNNINIGNENERQILNENQLFNNNNEINNKNYTMKKLTMNSAKSNINDIYKNPDNDIYYENLNNECLNNSENYINLKEKMKRIEFPSKKVNSFNNYNKIEIPNYKINHQFMTIPRKYFFAKGRIFKLPEKNDDYINLTMTEPNN